MVIAHRGYAKKFKENTIAAFNDAFSHGAGAIETDVRLTKDKKAVINHDDYYCLNKKKIKISDTNLDDILKNRAKQEERILTIEELFEYINNKDMLLYLEVKDNSKILFNLIIGQMQKYDLWDKVYLIGFYNRIKTALKFQDKYPELKVSQILRFPLFSYIRKPKKSYGAYIGWLDGIKYSELFFKSTVSKKRLIRIKKYLENLGFHVSAGVINRQDGFKLFHEAGIDDIFTDEVELCHKQQQQF